MNDPMINTAISFVGGSRGHLVYNIFNNILYDTEIHILPNGSSHVRNKDTLFVANKYELDDNSYEQEQEYLEYFVEPLIGEGYKTILGHIRNLKTLSLICDKVIYIDFDKNDIEELHNNIIKKTVLDRDTYEMLRGADWPEYSDQLPSSILDEIYELNKKHFKEWKYILPDDKSNILKIEYKDILKGKWLSNLFTFLEVKETKSKMEYLHKRLDSYMQKQ